MHTRRPHIKCATEFVIFRTLSTLKSTFFVISVVIESEHGHRTSDVLVLTRHDDVVVDVRISHAPARFASALRASLGERDQTDEFVAVEVEAMDCFLHFLREQLAQDGALVARVARQVLETRRDDVTDGLTHGCAVEGRVRLQLEGGHASHGVVGASSCDAVSQLTDEALRGEKREDGWCRV